MNFLRILVTGFIVCTHSITYGQKPTLREKEESMQSTLWLSISDYKNSTVKIDSIGFGDIPKEIDYRGIIVEALKWTDSLGTNILLLTQTGGFTFKDTTGEVNARAELNAYLFTKKKSEKTFSRHWKLYDFIVCYGVDYYAGYYQHSLSITDLDKDGFAEITFIYKLSCRGDTSPATQKLIMYEKNEKYAMRGETLIRAGDPKISSKNNFTPEVKLKNKQDFFEFAKKRWETIGEDDYKQFR